MPQQLKVIIIGHSGSGKSVLAAAFSYWLKTMFGFPALGEPNVNVKDTEPLVDPGEATRRLLGIISGLGLQVDIETKTAHQRQQEMARAFGDALDKVAPMDIDDAAVVEGGKRIAAMGNGNKRVIVVQDIGDKPYELPVNARNVVVKSNGTVTWDE